MAIPKVLAPPTRVARGLDVTDVHDEYGELVWKTLQRLGARPPDLDDLFQEVFVVVHRKLPTFRPDRALSPWLYGICIRVFSTYRRRAFRWRELPTVDLEPPSRGPNRPDDAAIARQAESQMRIILDKMPPKMRLVFVLFEIEEFSCAEIAAQLGVPVGTVHSRLHAARTRFRRAVERQARKAPHAD